VLDYLCKPKTHKPANKKAQNIKKSASMKDNSFIEGALLKEKLSKILKAYERKITPLRVDLPEAQNNNSIFTFDFTLSQLSAIKPTQSRTPLPDHEDYGLKIFKDANKRRKHTTKKSQITPNPDFPKQKHVSTKSSLNKL
jgi:hypothetical protein